MFTPLTVISLLVFFIYALQCLPTTAVVAREAGSWQWAVGQFVFMSGFAYLASLIVFQIGSMLPSDMNDWQTWAALAAVILATLFLVAKATRRKKRGCDHGCGCGKK